MTSQEDYLDSLLNQMMQGKKVEQPAQTPNADAVGDIVLPEDAKEENTADINALLNSIEALPEENTEETFEGVPDISDANILVTEGPEDFEGIVPEMTVASEPELMTSEVEIKVPADTETSVDAEEMIIPDVEQINAALDFVPDTINDENTDVYEMESIETNSQADEMSAGIDFGSLNLDEITMEEVGDLPVGDTLELLDESASLDALNMTELSDIPEEVEKPLDVDGIDLSDLSNFSDEMSSLVDVEEEGLPEIVDEIVSTDGLSIPEVEVGDEVENLVGLEISDTSESIDAIEEAFTLEDVPELSTVSEEESALEEKDAIMDIPEIESEAETTIEDIETSEEMGAGEENIEDLLASMSEELEPESDEMEVPEEKVDLENAQSLSLSDATSLSQDDINFLLSGMKEEEENSNDTNVDQDLLDLLGQSDNETEADISELLTKSDNNEAIDELSLLNGGEDDLEDLFGADELLASLEGDTPKKKGKKDKKKQKDKSEKKGLGAFFKKKKKEKSETTDENVAVDFDDIDMLLAQPEVMEEIVPDETPVEDVAQTEELDLNSLLTDDAFAELGAESIEPTEQSDMETQESGEESVEEASAEPVEEIEGLESDFLNDLLSGIDGEDAPRDNTEAKKEKKPKKEKKKEKKKGLLAKFLDALTEDEDEQSSEEEEIILSDENGDILRSLEDGEEKKGKQKGKKKKDKKKKGKEEASEEGDEEGADQKPEKKKKEKKPKKEKTPKLKEVDLSPQKKLSRRRVGLIFLICMTVCLVLILLISVGIDVASKNNAVKAFQEEDYETCYENLKGKHLSESQQIMYGKSESILRIRLWVREYEFFASRDEQENAVDCLLLAVRDYPTLYDYSNKFDATSEVGATYRHILDILDTSYGVDEETAQEIVSIPEDVIYTKIVKAIVANENYKKYLNASEDIEETGDGLQDLLPEEEELIPLE